MSNYNRSGYRSHNLTLAVMITNLQVYPLNIHPCIFYYLLLLHSVSQLSACKSSLTPWTSRQFIAGLHRKTICTHTNAQFQVHSSSHAQGFGLQAERSHMDASDSTRNDERFHQSRYWSETHNQSNAALIINMSLCLFFPVFRYIRTSAEFQGLSGGRGSL